MPRSHLGLYATARKAAHLGKLLPVNPWIRTPRPYPAVDNQSRRIATTCSLCSKRSSIEAVSAAGVDRDVRALETTSDHAPT